MNPMESIVRVSFSLLVPFRYLNAFLSFLQLSSSGFLTLVVKTDTAVWMSLLSRELRNSNWLVVWWNAIAFYSGRYFAFSESLMLNRWSVAGVAAFPWSIMGTNQWCCLGIWTLTLLDFRCPWTRNPFRDIHVYSQGAWLVSVCRCLQDSTRTWWVQSCPHGHH